MWDTQRRKGKLAYIMGEKITILANVFQQNKSILAYGSQPQSEVKLHKPPPGGIPHYEAMSTQLLSPRC